MCNSLSLQLPQPSNAANVVYSNARILPHYSIGKILPKDTPVKPEEGVLSEQQPHSHSLGKTVVRSDLLPSPTVHSQLPTIEDLRGDQNLAKSKLPFLWKLHILLDDVEATGNDHIVSWLEHGRSFKVYRPKSFIAMIAPYYFKQSKYKSFQRQLHLYEFTRVQYGPEAGSYSHPLFVRGEPHECLSLSPIKIKGKARQQQRQAAAAAMATATAALQRNTINEKQALRSTFPITTTAPSNASAVLSKREQDEWVAKIRKMIVTGSALAAELKLQDTTQPLNTTSLDTARPTDMIVDEGDNDDTCSVFGVNFHPMPQQEDVSSCEHCCESDTEDGDDEGGDLWNPFLLVSE